MKQLRLTLACWDYDRTRALIDGSVAADGIDLVYLNQPVEETFFRMLRYREFDCSEMSLSSYCASLHSERPPFIAIPVFPSRYFRHSCIFVSAKSGIRQPADLKGKRIGVPEYQMTAPVWIRGILSDDYGVKVTDVQHLSGGEEEPGRDEKLKINVPPSIRLQPIPGDKTLSRMLADGERAVDLPQGAGQGEAAFPQLRGGREGILPAQQALSDHARHRDPPRRL
jgi:4,5-dihydroxyphthalate decarboxylase